MTKYNLLNISSRELIVSIIKEYTLPHKEQKITTLFYRKCKSLGFDYLRLKFSDLSDDDRMDIAIEAMSKLHYFILTKIDIEKFSQKGSLYNYYKIICKNSALDLLKKQQKNHEEKRTYEFFVKNKSMDEYKEKNFQQRAINLEDIGEEIISKKDMQILEMKYVHQFSHREIAKHYDIKEQGAKNKVHKCMKKIRKNIMNSNNEPLKKRLSSKYKQETKKK